MGYHHSFLSGEYMSGGLIDFVKEVTYKMVY